MGIEYIAVIAEENYKAFKILVTTTLPRDYEMWLRVRERGKLRAVRERGAVLTEIEVSPEEFGAYCKRRKRPDFSIAALDLCARDKATGQGCEPAVFARRAAQARSTAGRVGRIGADRPEHAPGRR